MSITFFRTTNSADSAWCCVANEYFADHMLLFAFLHFLDSNSNPIWHQQQSPHLFTTHFSFVRQNFPLMSIANLKRGKTNKPIVQCISVHKWINDDDRRRCYYWSSFLWLWLIDRSAQFNWWMIDCAWNQSWREKKTNSTQYVCDCHCHCHCHRIDLFISWCCIFIFDIYSFFIVTYLPSTFILHLSSLTSLSSTIVYRGKDRNVCLHIVLDTIMLLFVEDENRLNTHTMERCRGGEQRKRCRGTEYL